MKQARLRSNLVFALFTLCLVFAGAGSAEAQLGGLGGVTDKLRKKNPVSSLLEGKPPITTSLEDAKWGDSSLDSFTPREAARSLMTLQRTPNASSPASTACRRRATA